MTRSTATLASLLLEPPPQQDQPALSDWLPVWAAAQGAFATQGPFIGAVAAALRADRLAWAFFAGYQGALQAAFPDRMRPSAAGQPRVAMLCANESGRKVTEIETRLVTGAGGARLDGSKSWSLAGLEAPDLFVLARRAEGPASGPGSLVVVHLRQPAEGAEQQAPRAQSFVPELPHAVLTLRSVRVSSGQIVPGDGYADHVKPFRLREDLFVSGCALACLLAHAHRMGWPSPWRQRCVAAIVLLAECAALAPAEPATIVLSAGAAAVAAEVFEAAEALWSERDAVQAARWQRDQALLSGGRDARRQRALKAWAQVDANVPRNA